MLDHNGWNRGASPGSNDGGLSTVSMGLSTPASPASLVEARALNDLGDRRYYDARWSEAHHEFSRALAITRRLTDAEGDPDAWALTSTVARNLGILAWLRGDAEQAQPKLDEARQACERVEDAHRRWYLRLDLDLFDVLVARTQGRNADALHILDGLRPVAKHADTGVFLRLRTQLETANVERQMGDHDGSWRRLLLLSADLGSAQTGTADWPAETQLVHERLADHYRTVTQVERVLFRAMGGDVQAEDVGDSLAILITWLSNRQGDTSQPGYRLYALRERKAAGWVQWFLGDPRALATSADVVKEANSLGDWRTHALGLSQQSGALLLAGEAEQALGCATDSFQECARRDYWKGRLLAALMGWQAAAALKSQDELASWGDRLDAADQQGMGALPRLARQSRAQRPLVPLATRIMTARVRAAVRQAEQLGLPPGSMQAPATRRLLAFGPALAPLLLHILPKDLGEWPALLRALTRFDPLAEAAERSPEVESAAWRRWGEGLLAT